MDEFHQLSEMFLAGAIVNDGEIGLADKSYVLATAKLLKKFQLPLSPELVEVAAEKPNYRDRIQNIPFKSANISEKHDDIDYLEMPTDDLDLLVLCNIPVESREHTTDSVSTLCLVNSWHKTQDETGTTDSHKLSPHHSPEGWTKKINADRPYVAAFVGDPSTLRADDMKGQNYVSIKMPEMPQGILVDKNYLQDMTYPLTKAWAETKKMPLLIPVIQSLSQNPTARSFEWSYEAQRLVPTAGDGDWRKTFRPQI